MLTDDAREGLALTLYDIGAVQIGKFRLHSGQTARIYIDLNVLVSYPAVLREVTNLYRQLLAPLTFDLLSATPYAGLPIGTALALALDCPLIYSRKMSKSYGTGKAIEGHWEVGQTAVVVDDLITSGESILHSIVALKGAGLQVKEAVVLIDREQGGRELLADQGYTLHSAFSLNALLATLESKERITAKQRAKVLKSLQNERS